jgi:hypothetical protein
MTNIWDSTISSTEISIPLISFFCFEKHDYCDLIFIESLIHSFT